MQDVLITPDSNGLYDISINGADFEGAEGFETAIPVSLFTDARVEGHIVQNALYRRGWVGNILFVEIERQLGSSLWTLDQARVSDDTINNARVASQECLQWMIDDDILSSIFIDVVQESKDRIVVFIEFADIDNVIKRYKTLWRRTDAVKLSTV